MNIFYNPAGNNNSTVNSTSYKSPTNFSSYVSGGATLNAYMLVNTVYDLQNIQNNLSGAYALGANINATSTAGWNGGAGFNPIGLGGSSFTGVLNGQGDTITGLTIKLPGANNVGLISVINSPGVVENLGLVGGSVAGATNVGALAGGINNGMVLSDYASTTVTGTGNYTGGLLGFAGGVVTSSSASGAVSGVNYVGGLIGGLYSNLSGDSASGAVSGNNNVGGLVGYSPSSNIANSFATGAVTGVYAGNTSASYIGGLVGSTNDAVSQSYATGVVSTPGDRSSFVGGLVGQAGGAVTQSYATGAVVGSNNGQDFGGLIGSAFAPMSQDYATGAVSGGYGATFLGGLIGQMNGGTSISQSWSSGAVAVTRQYAGGLVGYYGGGSISSSYWDTTTSGHTTSAGGGTGLTTSQFFNPANFSGFTFGTTPGASGWVIVDSDGTFNGSNGATRPILLSEYATTLTNAHQLELANLNLSANYTLGANIDASATNGAANAASIWGAAGFVPIAAGSTAYVGTFDGQGHTIAGLYINEPSASGAVGLFGTASGALRNVGLTGVSVTGGSGTNAATGGLAGIDTAGVSNSSVTGAVSGGADVGGLVGYQTGATISQSYATAQVNGGGGSNSGGLVGLQDTSYSPSTITGSYATGAVTGGDSVGGLVGSELGGTVGQSYATGRVSGSGYAFGGLVGYQLSGAISQSYATGAVGSAGEIEYVGGLVGYDYGGTTNQSYASGAVGGGAYVGGLVGYTNNTASLQQSYASGAVTAPTSSQYVGGLVGYNGGTISQAYALGAVTVGLGSDSVGGLVGATGQTISQTYATGAVAAPGSSNVGGLAGNASSGLVTASYWDQQTTGQAASAGGGTGLTTSQFYTASNLSGLTFGTTGGASGFVIVDTDGTLNNAGGAAGAVRPMLLSEYSTSIVNVHQLQLMELNIATNYTLGAAIDASATTGASAAGLWTTAGFVPIGTNANSARYVGVFNGQGFTINGLTMNRATGYDGLFGYATGATTVLENVGIVGGSFAGTSVTGALVGMTGGNALLLDDYSTAPVSVSGAYAGGLVGRTGGSIIGSYATGAVSGQTDIGGLAGSSGVVSQSYATGSVTGQTYLGGLSGYSNGTVTQSYATGAVTGTLTTGSGGYVGGLLGYNNSNISNDYATGAVIAVANNTDVGGLVGDEQGGTIYQSYARGAVTAGANAVNVGGLVGVSAYSTTATTTQDYATGVVTVGSGSANVGGLEGHDLVNTSQSYATGAVNASGATNVGGLIGVLDDNRTVDQSYATGQVTGGSAVGGLIGLATSGSQATNSYYDADTTGQALGYQGSQGTGVHTNSLQSASGLPSGFNSSAWSIVAGESYPYLTWQFSGTPQVVSGIAASSGGSGLAGATVAAFSGGLQLASALTGGVVTTGANGFYYYLLAPGTLGVATTDHTGVTLTAAGGGAPIGLSYAGSSLTDGSTTGLNLAQGLVSATTGEGAFSVLNSDLGATFGVANYASLNAALIAAQFQLTTSGGFTVDQSVSRAGSFSLTTNGSLTVSSAIGSTAGGVSLNTLSGNLTLGANVSAGSGAVILNTAGQLTQTSGAITAPLLDVTAAGASLSLANAVTTLGYATASTGDFNFTDNQALTVNGPVTVQAGDLTLVTNRGALALAGALSDPYGTLTLSGAGGISQSGGTITAVTLAGSAGGAVTLGQNGNSFATLGSFNVSTGDLNLTDAGTLTIAGPVTVTTGSFTPTASGLDLSGQVTTGGNQTYATAVLLTGNSSLTGTGSGTISFASTIDGAYALSVNSGRGATDFTGALGSTTQLASLTTTGGADLNGGAVTTSGAQDYTGALVLGANTTLTAGSSSSLTFNAISGAHALTLATSGLTTLAGTVNGLTSLTTGTGQLQLGAGVTTTGAQTYNGSVTLAASDTLTGSLVKFISTVDGGYGLAVSGASEFDGAIGATTSPRLADHDARSRCARRGRGDHHGRAGLRRRGDAWGRHHPAGRRRDLRIDAGRGPRPDDPERLRHRLHRRGRLDHPAHQPHHLQRDHDARGRRDDNRRAELRRPGGARRIGHPDRLDAHLRLHRGRRLWPDGLGRRPVPGPHRQRHASGVAAGHRPDGELHQWERVGGQ